MPGPFYLPWRRGQDAKGSPLDACAELARDEAFRRPHRAAAGQEEDRSANPHRHGLPADPLIQVPQIHLHFSPLAHGIALEVPQLPPLPVFDFLLVVKDVALFRVLLVEELHPPAQVRKAQLVRLQPLGALRVELLETLNLDS